MPWVVAGQPDKLPDSVACVAGVRGATALLLRLLRGRRRGAAARQRRPLLRSQRVRASRVGLRAHA